MVGIRGGSTGAELVALETYLLSGRLARCYFHFPKYCYSLNHAGNSQFSQRNSSTKWNNSSSTVRWNNLHDRAKRFYCHNFLQDESQWCSQSTSGALSNGLILTTVLLIAINIQIILHHIKGYSFDSWYQCL